MPPEPETAALVKVKTIRRMNKAVSKKFNDWELAKLAATAAKQEYEEAVIKLRDEIDEDQAKLFEE